MPVYDYICKECGKEFELHGTFEMFFHIDIRCPDCGSKDIRRKFFPTPIIYKADGFTKKTESE